MIMVHTFFQLFLYKKIIKYAQTATQLEYLHLFLFLSYKIFDFFNLEMKQLCFKISDLEEIKLINENDFRSLIFLNCIK